MLLLPDHEKVERIEIIIIVTKTITVAVLQLVLIVVTLLILDHLAQLKMTYVMAVERKVTG